jgi:hypothetical protein
VIKLDKDYETGVQTLHGKTRLTEFANKSDKDAKPSK